MSYVSPGRVTLVRWGWLLWVPALCAAVSLVLPWFRPRYLGPYGSFDVGAQYIGPYRLGHVLPVTVALLVLGWWLPRGLPTHIPRRSTAAMGALVVLLGVWFASTAYLRWGAVTSDAPRFGAVPARTLAHGAEPGFYLLVAAAVLTIAMGLAMIAQDMPWQDDAVSRAEQGAQ